MPRDDNTVGLEIETAIAFVFTWVAEEDAMGRAGCEFVGSTGIEIRKAQATEHVEMIICGMGIVKTEVWSLMVYGTRWADVE
jgi:hypothetical protein